MPLVFGLYWKRATTQGAIVSIAVGIAAWLVFLMTPAGEAFPAQLAGFLAAIVGMVAGSLAPQAVSNRRDGRPEMAGAGA